MTKLPIVIRPIRPEDKQALRDGTDRLSERSRYRRFLSPRGSLTPAELTYFTEVDHHDHEALVAIDPITGEGIGVARYIRSPVHPDAAELAVAVADDWQHRGVGTGLTEALAHRARQEGVARFTALLFADNTPMLHLIKTLGVVHDMSLHQGIVELTVELPPTESATSPTSCAPPPPASCARPDILALPGHCALAMTRRGPPHPIEPQEMITGPWTPAQPRRPRCGRQTRSRSRRPQCPAQRRRRRCPGARGRRYPDPRSAADAQ